MASGKPTNKQTSKHIPHMGLRNSHSVETERNRRSSDCHRDKSRGELVILPVRLFVRVHESKSCGSSDDIVSFRFRFPIVGCLNSKISVG